MSEKIRVSILDDHQGIVDGYLYRLNKVPRIEILDTLMYGDDLEPALKKQTPDVLLLDVHVPASQENSSPYPINYVIPRLLQRYPDLAVLVISMHTERGIIRTVMESGASGYIFKDDQKAIQELGNIIQLIANNGIYLSEKAYKSYKSRNPENEELLTPRQLEALSLCAAYPDSNTAELAKKMQIANSTVRNLLSGVYFRLGVSSRTAAIAKGRQMGIIASDLPALQL